MKTRITLLSASLLALVFAGCASPQGQYSNREVNVLGGLIKTEERAYDRSGPLTIGLKSSEIDPSSKLDGDKVTVFWGLFTFSDE